MLTSELPPPPLESMVKPAMLSNEDGRLTEVVVLPTEAVNGVPAPVSWPPEAADTTGNVCVSPFWGPMMHLYIAKLLLSRACNGI